MKSGEKPRIILGSQNKIEMLCYFIDKVFPNKQTKYLNNQYQHSTIVYIRIRIYFAKTHTIQNYSKMENTRAPANMIEEEEEVVLIERYLIKGHDLVYYKDKANIVYSIKVEPIGRIDGNKIIYFTFRLVKSL